DERTVVIFNSDNGGLSTPEGRHTPATNNAPLRAGKGHIYEGGIREPLIVRWPGRVKPNSVNHTPVCSVDFYMTMLDMAVVAKPAAQHVGGVSLLPLMTGAGELPERKLYWHYPHFSNQCGDPAGAVRDADYKLIEYYEDGRLELYHLRNDVSEQT